MRRRIKRVLSLLGVALLLQCGPAAAQLYPPEPPQATFTPVSPAETTPGALSQPPATPSGATPSVGRLTASVGAGVSATAEAPPGGVGAVPGGPEGLPASVEAGARPGPPADAGGAAGEAPPALRVVGRLRLNRPSTLPGGEVMVGGEGCPPDSPVTFAIDGQTLGSTTADANGRFQSPVRLPRLPVGRFVLAAECDGVRLETPIDLVISASKGRSAGAAVASAGAVFLFVVLLSQLLTHGRDGGPTASADPQPRSIT